MDKVDKTDKIDKRHIYGYRLNLRQVGKFNMLVIALVFIASSCNTQSKEQQKEEQQNNIEEQIDLSFIENKSIEYGFFRMLNTTVAPFVHYAGLSVHVLLLTEEQDEIVRKLDKQTWLNLLNSPNSDFAANLILYDIYNKDGTGLSVLEEEDSSDVLWRKYYKAEDLDYWGKYLDSIGTVSAEVK